MVMSSASERRSNELSSNAGVTGTAAAIVLAIVASSAEARVVLSSSLKSRNLAVKKIQRDDLLLCTSKRRFNTRQRCEGCKDTIKTTAHDPGEGGS